MMLPGLRPVFGALWLALAMVLVLSGTARAQGVFLDFDGEIEGDSTVEGFEDWIVITSLGTEVLRESAVTKPQFSEITLTKRTDRASPRLWRYAILGTHFAEARMVVIDDDGDVLFELVAEDVVLMGFSLGTAGGAASEQVTLTFGRITFAYTPPGGGGVVTACWDLANEVSC